MAASTEHARASDSRGVPTSRPRLAILLTAAMTAGFLAGLSLLAMAVRQPKHAAREEEVGFVASAPTRTVPPPRALLGAGSCTSAGCHASAVDGHAAWQSSYTVWATRDPHARAERVLHEPLAGQIVALLAARDPSRPAMPAHEHTACIGCHTTGRGPLANAGVSCESCHGAAGDWLVAHTLPDWRTAGNTLGMVDLADPFICAQQCAGCHVGGPPAADGAPREVSHDLIAAGHPRLAFELRSFKRSEPPHWRDRFAAVPSSPSGTESEAVNLDPLDEWASGRLGAIHVFLDQMSRQSAASTRSRAGTTAATWPEFTAFDCYGCHRPPVAAIDRGGDAVAGPLRSPPDPARTDSRPLGTPRLEPLHWALLDLVMPAEAAARLTAFRHDVERRWWERPEAVTISACLDAIDASRAHVHPGLAKAPTDTLARRVVDGIDPATWDEATAALAALEAIVARAASRGAPPASLAAAVAGLDRLRGLLEFPGAATAGGVRFDSPHGYDPRAVAAELGAIAVALETVR